MNKIYVGNLPFSTTEASLREEFQKFGNIQEAVLIKDRYTGKSKGFGFITYSSQQEASDAVSNMDGKPFEGRNLKVNIARENTGGNGGGRRREGGGGWGRGDRDQY